MEIVRWFLCAVLVTMATSGQGAESAKESLPTWPWPGPTPPEIREPMMKKRHARRPTEQELQKIEAAAPEKAPAVPAKPRRILCWGRLWTHLGNAFTEETVKILGRKTGAFEVVAGDDPQLLLPESLKTFDALFLNGLHDPQPFLPLNWRELPPEKTAEVKKLDAAVKQSILEFVVEDGKGIAGIEGSIDPKGEPLRSARFRLIMRGMICFNDLENIYVADRWNHCIRKVDLEAEIVTVVAGPGRGYVDGPAEKSGFHDSPGHVAYDPYRGRLYANGVDDWGLRTLERGSMKTIAGGARRNQATEGPAGEAGIHWAGVRAVDPRPPLDLETEGRIWRLKQV